jgi:hypothetical protein
MEIWRQQSMEEFIQKRTVAYCKEIIYYSFKQSVSLCFAWLWNSVCYSYSLTVSEDASQVLRLSPVHCRQSIGGPPPFWMSMSMSMSLRNIGVDIYIVTHSGLAWLIKMGSGVDDWVYWHFFKIIVNRKSSHIELLLNEICLTNLSEESLTNLLNSEPESEFYVTTDGQSASLSWNKAPI